MTLLLTYLFLVYFLYDLSLSLSLSLQRRGPTASLAQDPKTPRYMSDIDPVGERERERRKREKERIYQSHAKATAKVAANNRASNALVAHGRNPRDNFEADEEDTTDYLSNPSGHPDHDAMAERGRQRRAEKGMLRQDEEKAVAEAARRQASRNKAKKRRWLRERDTAARQKQQQMLDEENRGKGINVQNQNDSEELDGDLSSDTDSDEERRHVVNKAGIDAFVKRQEEAERKKAAKVRQIEEELRLKNAKRWQTTSPYIEGGETGDLVLPPAPPETSTSPTPQYPVGTGSRAALALSKARAALGEASPRKQVKPSVVSLGL